MQATNAIQGRLISLAALFLCLYALALTLAPAARAHSWQVVFPWEHWGAIALWLILFFSGHQLSARWMPKRDPYLLPVAGLLSGWGLLVIWRLYPVFGLRQSIWLLIAMIVLVAGLRFPSILGFLRRYKYLWLTGGLLLTALTLFFGTNPLGYGPRMWLGRFGIYLQPSEPLKLLLIVYLAAYLADRMIFPASSEMALPVFNLREKNRSGAKVFPSERLISPPLLPLLAPTLIMTGLALLLLTIQRDLGTASIFLFLYTTIVYITTGRRRILLIGLLAISLAGVFGYALFDVVRVRIDAWINPWIDPSGRSYQIVQSLLAIANGGLIGRGPGLGSPRLVPIPHSDFIFASIVEETGLVGGLGLLLLIALLASRGIRAALNAADSYQRYLAAGLTAYLAGQSILIIGGNLRLLPLTGVTLPFVSYGGSSLLTSYLSLLILIHISNNPRTKPAPLPDYRPYLQLNAFLLFAVIAAGLFAGWWALYRSSSLLTRTDNPRRAITDRLVQRGSILDRSDQPLSASFGEPGSYIREILYPDLSSVLGYTNPIYGQSGLEAGLDSFLRGVQGYPARTLWLEHLLYGQPPPGLDVRLSLDLKAQKAADESLGGQTGAVVLLNARSGEILALASHPTFNANRLDETWQNLIQDPRAPLLNRTTLGLYPPGVALGPEILAKAYEQEGLPALPDQLAYSIQGSTWRCALALPTQTWSTVVANGCPGAVAALGRTMGAEKLQMLFAALGLHTTPQIGLPADSSPQPASISDPASVALGQDLRISPLQMALAAASLSANGIRPSPVLVTALKSPQEGWVTLPAQGKPEQVFQPGIANATAMTLADEENSSWQSVSTAANGPGNTVTWYTGGTLPGWQGTPLAIVILIEKDDPGQAMQIGQSVLRAAVNP